MEACRKWDFIQKASNDLWMLYNKLGRAWQEEAMSKFKILSLHLSEGTEETATKSLGEFSRYLV
jgi:hypothetical protein